MLTTSVRWFFLLIAGLALAVLAFLLASA